MRFFANSLWLSAVSWFTLIQTVAGLDSTDTITWGGDNSRSGYQNNHNLDPAVVGSTSFGQIFKTQLPGNFNNIGAEQLFSQPLVYTGADGVQYVYLATTQNNVYKLDAKTGTIVAKRSLWTPFLTADLDGCTDINPTVGVTSTGVIDSDTSIWYLTAKTYSSQYQSGNYGPNNPPGRLNGRYYFHGIKTSDLSNAFTPVPLEGTVFRNNNRRQFISGNQHQRPALLLVNNFVYAGFASHCVKWNYTGLVMGFNKNTGAIVESYTMEAGPEANTVPGGGVWMSGGGIAYDGKGSMFFSTGNGYASQLPATGKSVPGRTPPTALEEAAVNAKINDDGTIQVTDFFMPWEKTDLDGADNDLGTSPLQLLPSTFSCPNHRRIGVITGKAKKTYWLNLDNLGGYQNGPNAKDAVIQTFVNENSVYAGAGVMPLGGGYIYINVIQYPSHVFKFSCNSNGDAVFTKVADTPEKCAYILGVGHGTTTSLNDQEGTGLFWVTDVEGLNLRIYNAVPAAGANTLKLINSFNIPGVTKFSRPVFGNGRAYVGTTQGFFYGFGSPVNVPLNCSSPYTFPKTYVGSNSSPLTVKCVANIKTTVNSIALTGNPNFVLSNVPNTPISLDIGGSFQLTATFQPRTVGLLSSDIVVNTTNAVTGYTPSSPVTLKGQANSANPILGITPQEMSFSTIVGNAADAQSFIYNNNGDGTLTFTNISFSQTSKNGPWLNVPISGGKATVGSFSFTNLPTTIPGNGNAAVTISYNPSKTGTEKLFVRGYSNGGNADLYVLGTANTKPIALFEFQTPDGSSWVKYVPGQPFTFGNVTENMTRNLKFRITNVGDANAASLGLTVSKPPYGVPGFVGAANAVDLGEGTRLAAGQSQTASLYCSPPKAQVNTPAVSQSVQWTINTDDLTMGKQIVGFVCNAVSNQVGPLYSNQTAIYKYIGCARDNNPGRQLNVQIYTDNNNTNGRCITTCNANGYVFAGTQYRQECWCGNAIPLKFDSDSDCNFPCTGSSLETCGGNGLYGNTTEISLFADSTRFNGNTTSPPLRILPSYYNFKYAGCYAESGGKGLNANSTLNRGMTVEFCGNFCSKYKMFGLENGNECYCGDTLNSAVVSTTADSQCSTVCPGNNSEYCGAGNRLLVYKSDGSAPPPVSSVSSSSSSASSTTSKSSVSSPAITTITSTSSPTPTSTLISTTSTTIKPATTTGVVPAASGFVSLGCYNENAGGSRVLSTLYASDQMTVELCAAQAAKANANYFGIEYARECFYGTTLSDVSKPIAQSSCSMTCPGNQYQWCGGPDALQMYQRSGGSASSSTITTIVTSTSTVVQTTTVSSATATGPVVVPSASNFASVGCYNENTGSGGRVLPNLNQSSAMTIEYCADAATRAQAVYFGVEYGQECWYGTTLSSVSQPIAQSSCNMVCPGNKLEYCGGGNALQMYKAKAATTTSGAVSQPSQKALACPSSNGTTWVAPSGSKFKIECGIDYAGGDISSTYTNTYEDCITACDKQKGCVDVSLSGTACYLKGSIGMTGYNSAIYGARLIVS